MTSNGIQSLFEAADCDVLILYDCCHSADTAIVPAHSLRGSTELIAACGFEAIAAEVGEHSFTNALIEVLVLCSSMSSFSVSQLHGRIIQQLKNWRPSPKQDESGRFVRDPHGRLVMEPQRRRTPVYCNLTHEGGRKQIMLSCMPLAPAVESFTPPLNNQSMSMGISPAIVTYPEPPSNGAASTNIDMIITVKMASEVVDGRQEADFDAWLEWLRSAPPEATQLEGIFFHRVLTNRILSWSYLCTPPFQTSPLLKLRTTITVGTNPPIHRPLVGLTHPGSLSTASGKMQACSAPGDKFRHLSAFDEGRGLKPKMPCCLTLFIRRGR